MVGWCNRRRPRPPHAAPINPAMWLMEKIRLSPGIPSSLLWKSTPQRAAAGLVPPRADAGHALVVAFDHLNRGATRSDIQHGRGRRTDILEQALVAPEAADGGHLNRRRRVLDLPAA